jgi:hypothetical protein
LCAAYPVIDRQVLHRLHVKTYSFNLGELWSKTPNNLGGGDSALVEWFQVNLDAAAVQRRVSAVGSNK